MERALRRSLCTVEPGFQGALSATISASPTCVHRSVTVRRALHRAARDGQS